MSAHFINESLFIVARAESEGAERKLLRAGASRVISPYAIGGHRVAQAVLRPNAMDFIELATRSAHLELQIEEIELRRGKRPRGCIAQGQPDQERARHHRRGHQEARRAACSTTPRPETVLAAGDVLITLGHRQHLDRLETMSHGPA